MTTTPTVPGAHCLACRNRQCRSCPTDFCGCAAEGHVKLRYAAHGDPFSDPPRAVVCRRCGALVDRDSVDLHDDWHGVRDPFGCLGGADHRWKVETGTTVVRTSCDVCGFDETVAR